MSEKDSLRTQLEMANWQISEYADENHQLRAQIERWKPAKTKYTFWENFMLPSWRRKNNAD